MRTFKIKVTVTIMVNTVVVTDLTHLAWVIEDILNILPFKLSFESSKPTPQRLGRRPKDCWRHAKRTKKLRKQIRRMAPIDVIRFWINGSVALNRSGKTLCMFVKRMTGHARNMELIVARILMAVSRDLQHRQTECVLCHKLS